jgi:hypothetical protein
MFNFQITILILQILLTLAGDCPTRWTVFKDNCYLILTKKEPFASAVKACPTGSFLAEISSQSEFEFLKNFVLKNVDKKSVWVKK